MKAVKVLCLVGCVAACAWLVVGCKTEAPLPEPAAEKPAATAEEGTVAPGETPPATKEPLKEEAGAPAGQKAKAADEAAQVGEAESDGPQAGAGQGEGALGEGEAAIKEAEALPGTALPEEPASAAPLTPEQRMKRAKNLVGGKAVVGLVGSDYLEAGDEGADGVKMEAISGSRKMPEVEKPRAMEKAFKLSIGDGGYAGSAYLDGGVHLGAPAAGAGSPTTPGTEEYKGAAENEFKKVSDQPMSTFSIDVDTASYSNMRRFITDGQRPPVDSVRIEEFINYFDYEYPEPIGEDPFSIVTEVSQCPWNRKNRLVLVGLQGRRMEGKELPASNLVFLIDVSGSMNDPMKLPLVKTGFGMLVGQLRPQDRVAIAVYAGAAGLILPSTPGDQKETILAALDRLEAGGSTAGAEGILLAYRTAKDGFIKGGNNRVILATDGDFNVGMSSDEELEKLIEEKRKEGVFLSVIGFGTGNYKDAKMEGLADKGNGNYAYIDSTTEANKLFVTGLTGTLFTIAKDVKIQIEFNPTRVREYRLIGYENRILAKEDFLDDKKDAGELGAGHQVTALYEVVPETAKLAAAEETRYTETKIKGAAAASGELMLVKLRYKHPEMDESVGLEQPAMDKDIALGTTSNNFRFASAVALFGMLLKDSKFKGDGTWATAKELATNAVGKDPFGYRAQLVWLIESAKTLQAAPTYGGGYRSDDRRYLADSSAGIRGVVGGKIDKNAVNQHFRRRSSAFKKCYESVLRKNPNVGGKLTLRIKIDLAGHATAKVVADQTGDPALAKCITDKIKTWTFPKPSGKAVEFTIPFVFRVM